MLRCPLGTQVDVPPRHAPTGVVDEGLHPLWARNENGKADGVVLQDCYDLVVPGPHHRCLDLEQLSIRKKTRKPRKLLGILHIIRHMPENRPDRHHRIHRESSVQPRQQDCAIPFLRRRPGVLVAFFRHTQLGQQVPGGVSQHGDVERGHQPGVVMVVEAGEGDHDAVQGGAHLLQPGEDAVLGAGLHVLGGDTRGGSHQWLICKLLQSIQSSAHRQRVPAHHNVSSPHIRISTPQPLHHRLERHRALFSLLKDRVQTPLRSRN
mmetsp:Transcript_31746/g.71194  ORF Transcript_31746/g.71194 Transcript_31746/m.71194 type:complete len:264 (-) Transcript_31746:83-874(-)